MRHISLVTVVFISYSTSTLFAQQCNNLLLKYFGFEPLNWPQSGADLPYCNHLKTAQTCCSAETVATFQARADEIANKLNNYDAARDLFLSQLNTRYYGRVVSLFEDINNNHLDDLQKVRSSDPSLADHIQTELQSITYIRDAVTLIQGSFDRNLQQYQRARRTCFWAAMEVRAEAWCVVCDPNYQNEGINDDGSVLFSNRQCQYITESCWEYFNQGAHFNILFQLWEAYWNLSLVSIYLNSVESSFTDASAAILNAQNPYKTISTQLPVIVPQKWTSGDGNCWDLLSGDSLLVELFTFNSSALLSAQAETISDQGGAIPQQAEIIAEQATIIAEQEEEEEEQQQTEQQDQQQQQQQKQQQQEKEGEGEVASNSNMEFLGPIENGFEFEFEFEGRMLFDGRMLFGVLDLIHEGASDPGLSYKMFT